MRLNPPSAPRNPFHHIVCLFCGLVFLSAGLLKLFIPFRDFIHQLGLPFPTLTAVGVTALEISGGLILLTHRFQSPVVLRGLAALLACDMLFAITLVGYPGLQGNVHRVAGYAVGNEPWRLPLEAVLLLALLWLAFSSDASTRHKT